ncbi:MAG: hypothetical protein HY716_11035 [Planctomycetes bacterium]|nr:hypothetical protein [Planctomycetota bacterium]
MRKAALPAFVAVLMAVSALFGAVVFGGRGTPPGPPAETPAEYRLAILGGMMDVAHPSYAPLFRDLLASSRDSTYLLLAIGGLEKMRDLASLPDLHRILASDLPESIREAARKAIDRIEGR